MGVKTVLTEYFDSKMAANLTPGLAIGQLTAGGATTTSSTAVTLSITVPSWVVAGMPIYDVTAGGNVGTVASVSGTGITLSANSATAITSGDVLQFGFPPADYAKAEALGVDLGGLTDLAKLKCAELIALLTFIKTEILTAASDSTNATVFGTEITALS